MHRNADGGSSCEFLKPWDMSHREVVTSISDVFIPECIMLCEATQPMLDLKHAYLLFSNGPSSTESVRDWLLTHFQYRFMSPPVKFSFHSLI